MRNIMARTILEFKVYHAGALMHVTTKLGTKDWDGIQARKTSEMTGQRRRSYVSLLAFSKKVAHIRIPVAARQPRCRPFHRLSRPRWLSKGNFMFVLGLRQEPEIA